MRRAFLSFITVISLCLTTIPSHGLEPLENYLRSSTLADPSALIVDTSDEKAYLEYSPDSIRTPASLLKLISTTAALHYVGTERRYTTSIWSTNKDGVFVFKGGMDPWLTSDSLRAARNKQRYLPFLVAKANTKNSKSITIYYSSMYKKDMTDLTTFLRKKKKIRLTSIPISTSDAEMKAKEQIATMTSEPITTMVSHAILWSVNELADRLGKEAVKKVGNPLTPQGITATFASALSDLGVDSTGLYAEDGSGLSKANRTTSRTLVALLAKIRNEPTYQSIYDGLPIAGLTGTLLKRFSTSPYAIGHVHAKTGLLRTVASLAGYIDIGNKEYAFAIIADEIKPGNAAQLAARKTLDEMLGAFVRANLASG